MHFEERARHWVHRRPAADAGHTAPQLFHLHHIDAGERRPLRERDIRRREAELPSKARPRHYLAADRVGTAEQPLGVREIARLERSAHARARDALAVKRY